MNMGAALLFECMKYVLLQSRLPSINLLSSIWLFTAQSASWNRFWEGFHLCFTQLRALVRVGRQSRWGLMVAVGFCGRT